MGLSEKVVAWTKGWFKVNGRKTAVLGISGGKDSAVVAAVCAKALGPGNVFGILMPNGVQPDIGDSRKVVDGLRIRHGAADIKPAYDAMVQCVEDVLGMPVSENARINIAPRLRMALLYAVAQTLSDAEGAKACVVGTGNKAESMVGYTTKGGDSMCDMDPIGDLWVDEVVQVGDELGMDRDIVHKAPADGLCGKTDEDRLGYSYADVKAVFTGHGDGVAPEKREAILAASKRSAHKRRMPDVYGNG